MRPPSSSGHVTAIPLFWSRDLSLSLSLSLNGSNIPPAVRQEGDVGDCAHAAWGETPGCSQEDPPLPLY